MEIVMSEQYHSTGRQASDPDYQAREVDGIFFDRQHLNRAVSALVAAGFKRADMIATLERQKRARRPCRGHGLAIQWILRGRMNASCVRSARAWLERPRLSRPRYRVYVVKTLKDFDGVVPSEDIILFG
jgi:hypothetical protein